MSIEAYSRLVANQRGYFHSGATRAEGWRRAQLKAVSQMLTERSSDFEKALFEDLRRPPFETNMLDIGYVVKEAAYIEKRLSSWMRPTRIRTPLALFPSRASVRHDPLGVCLIIGAWNYPVMLTLAPLLAAIAGGNTAIIKPSELAPATANLLEELVPLYLDKEAFTVVCGGPLESGALLEERFDHIFFTGSSVVGKRVMTSAAKNLTPVVLELGGKNPCVVHRSANLRVAARRIAQGRYANAGQSCTAPDYLLVFKEVRNEFLGHLKEAITQFYGVEPRQSPDYGRIVNTYHFDRLIQFLSNGSIYHGGDNDREELYVAPTILVDVKHDDPIMQEEVFGPILPVIDVETIDECIAFINAHPTPLGMYVFAEETQVSEQMLQMVPSGGVCINDCSLEALVRGLPFGGIGNSGVGKYHGEWGFHAFTNARGVLNHSTAVDLDCRYPPYGKQKWLKHLIERFL